jgi:hypothetical protein
MLKMLESLITNCIRDGVTIDFLFKTLQRMMQLFLIKYTEF